MTPKESERAPSVGDALDAGLRLAAELFNAGEYHAAHEVLDELWEMSPRADSDFLKGLIQACIALHHYRADNFEGAKKLYSGHRQYLGAFLPAHRGVDVAAFLGAMQGVLQPVVRASAGSEPRFDFERRPKLVLAGMDSRK
jgi:predicted metal-dependent hydrolase